MSVGIDERHRLAQTVLSDALRAKLAALMLALPDPTDQAAMSIWAAGAVPLVGGGQRRAAALAITYMHAVAPGSRPGSLTDSMRGTVVSRESPIAHSPLLRVWRMLGEGAELPEALDAGASYAGALASGDLQSAERSGLMEGALASGQEIVGWRKQLSGEPCEWCRKVGRDRVYRSADSVPFHDRDNCGVSPVLSGQTKRHGGVGYRVLRA